MKNLILILIAIIVFVYLFQNKTESFSLSGINFSDRYCDKLVATYRTPYGTYVGRVCGPQRLNTIDEDVGNYFKYHNMLV